MRHAIPISGKDSAAAAIVQRTLRPDIDYDYFFNPTGAELPPTVAWIDGPMSAYLGKPIRHIGRNLEEIIDDHGILPSQQVRYCTREAKIHPMEDFFKGEPATVYYGIRADEQRVGYQQRSKKIDITPAYPLREAGMGLRDVWTLLEGLKLLPPSYFWAEMYERVKVLLGVVPEWLDQLEPWERKQLFAWRSRDNCFFCFFQRQYEWVGLAEHYPDLFERAVEIEETTGAAGYTWNPDRHSLRSLAARAEEIKKKRAEKIHRAIVRKAKTGIFKDDDAGDLLGVVSCGLFCGK